MFGKDAVRIAVRDLVAHYHGERTHQGIGNPGIFSELVSLATLDRIDVAAPWAEC